MVQMLDFIDVRRRGKPSTWLPRQKLADEAAIKLVMATKTEKKHLSQKYIARSDITIIAHSPVSASRTNIKKKIYSFELKWNILPPQLSHWTPAKSE